MEPHAAHSQSSNTNPNGNVQFLDVVDHSVGIDEPSVSNNDNAIDGLGPIALMVRSFHFPVYLPLTFDRRTTRSPLMSTRMRLHPTMLL